MELSEKCRYFACLLNIKIKYKIFMYKKLDTFAILSIHQTFYNSMYSISIIKE